MNIAKSQWKKISSKLLSRRNSQNSSQSQPASGKLLDVITHEQQLLLSRNLKGIRDEHFVYWKNQLSSRSEFIFLAAMPKTGSSFLDQVLKEVTGYSTGKVIFWGDDSDQQLDMINVFANFDQPTITQVHIKATKANLQILDLFSIKPIIVIRNIFDITASVVDHLRYITLISQRAHFNESFYDFPEQIQVDAVIDMIIPWYIEFYVSWKRANENGFSNLWLSYEYIMANKVKSIHEILKYYQINKNDQEIENAIFKAEDNKKKTRFNKGIVGRGQTLLTREQKERIKKYASYYPDIDFTSIGLD